MSRSIAKTTTHSMIRCDVFFTFLSISSQTAPVPNSRMPATIKSDKVQFTSSVNCMAMRGINNSKVTMSIMPINLLFCITEFELFIRIILNIESTLYFKVNITSLYSQVFFYAVMIF